MYTVTLYILSFVFSIVGVDKLIVIIINSSFFHYLYVQVFTNLHVLQGFVIIEKFFDIEADLEPCRRAIEELVEELAQKLYKAGKIKSMSLN